MRSFISRHRVAVTAASAGAVALIVFVLVWFQPQKLFIHQVVEEAAPSAAASLPPDEVPAAGGESAAAFRSLAHETSGTARVIEAEGGGTVVRFEDLVTSNGPDLRVWLSPAPSDSEEARFADGAVDLGALKGDRGDQNYLVPPDVDLSRYESVVIWCRRFSVGFAVAPLR